MRSRLRSSEGFGGLGPEASTSMLGWTGEVCTASASVDLAEQDGGEADGAVDLEELVHAGLAEVAAHDRDLLARPGRRRWPGWPAWLLLPSPALALVTWTRRIGRSRERYCRVVRRPRKASATADVGSSTVLRRGLGGVPPRRVVRDEGRGRGVPRARRSRSALVRTESSS